jgi:hypothetical protein
MGLIFRRLNPRLLPCCARRNTLAGTRDKKIGGLAGNVFHFDVLVN